MDREVDPGGLGFGTRSSLFSVQDQMQIYQQILVFANTLPLLSSTRQIKQEPTKGHRVNAVKLSRLSPLSEECHGPKITEQVIVLLSPVSRSLVFYTARPISSRQDSRPLCSTWSESDPPSLGKIRRDRGGTRTTK